MNNQIIQDAQIEVDNQYLKKVIKPDREKLIAFSQFLLQGISFPEVKSKKAENILSSAKQVLNEVSMMIFESAHAL